MSGIFRWLSVALLCVTVGGCFSSSRGKTDEEKEPYYQAGKSLVSSRDFDGAIKAFEKALEVNPHSASAHFELGVLYENGNLDCAAAIYHFRRYLELMSTNVPNAGMINDHILACKQVLARDVMLGPGNQNAQQELQRLTDENQRLRDENQKWRAWGASHSQEIPGGAFLNSSSNVFPGGVSGGNSTTISNQPASRRSTERGTSNTATAVARTYKVMSGDTMASIARKNGLNLNALTAANPGVQPQKMRVGQLLNLPVP